MSVISKFLICVWVIALTAFLGTISLSPVQWCDEAQIVDYGRVLCGEGGSESKGITTMKDGKQHLQIGVISAFSTYQITTIAAFDFRGNRLVCILGAFLSALLLVYYAVKVKKESIELSLGLGLLLFCDPLFVSGFKGGRWDWLVLSLHHMYGFLRFYWLLWCC